MGPGGMVGVRVKALALVSKVEGSIPIRGGGGFLFKKGKVSLLSWVEKVGNLLTTHLKIILFLKGHKL